MHRPSIALAAIALTVASSWSALAADAAPATPGAIARKQIDAGAARDWATLRTLYADNVRYVDPNGESAGVDAAIAALEKTLKPFGKVTVAVSKIYEGKDYAVAEWTASAINSGEITLADGSQVPPTGNEVNLSIVTIYDIKDGKIASERNYYDALTLYGSLGLLGD
jgi:predicted ester cyclase